MPRQVTAGEEIVQIEEVQPAPRLQPTRRARRWSAVAACAAIVCLLFAAYLRLSWTAPINSDGAADIFQVHDMLQGNVLLHGWWLSDASFYTTELPQYALIEALLGQVPAVDHVAAAMTYTLVVLFAAVLAKGQATGRAGAFRMLIAAGIMLAPQPGSALQGGGGAFVLDLSLGHIGTAFPLLLTCLILDRAGKRRWVPPAVGILLAWVLVADPLVFYVGVCPVVAVYGMRAYREVAGRRSVRPAWFEIATAASAAAAVPVASAVSAVLRSLGGFTVYPDHPLTATGSMLVSNVTVTFESVLTLFGANFLGLHVGWYAAGALLHLVGVALVGSAVWLGARRLVRGGGAGGPVDELLAVAVLANLFAFVFSTLAIDPSYAREIALVLPLGAALAGRMLPDRLASARMGPLLGAVLLGYVATLGYGVAQSPVPVQNQQLARWLVAQHLRYGLAAYWQASSVTLASGELVDVRPIDIAPHGKVGAYPWESDAAWYDPRHYYANFVILDPGTGSYSMNDIRKTFGKPARSYGVGPYVVLVWHKNLLVGLGCGEVYSRATGTASAGGPRCS